MKNIIAEGDYILLLAFGFVGGKGLTKIGKRQFTKVSQTDYRLGKVVFEWTACEQFGGVKLMPPDSAFVHHRSFFTMNVEAFLRNHDPSDMPSLRRYFQ